MPNKTITQIKGNFRLPSYQRGYRWTSDEVKRLLEDLHEWRPTNKHPYYYLQPIVLKNLGKNAEGQDEYELIDGQQRLTTLRLIMMALKKHLPSVVCPYTLTYDTRNKSKEFMEWLTDDPDKAISHKNDYIDFRYLHNAYTQITKWIDGQSDPLDATIKLYQLLANSVKVLWYEAAPGESGQELFKRLNIGRIPLTNAELVKALFLNRGSIEDSGLPSKNLRQEEIATQWDRMEKELHNENIWLFLTNAKGDKYPTRIELIFDFMAGKKPAEREKYFTFYYFQNRLNGKCGPKVDRQTLWNEIVDYYDKLMIWYNDRSLYNRAGALVAMGGNLNVIINDVEKQRLKKKEQIKHLESKILERIASKEELLDLRYGHDDKKIRDTLIWFNVKTMDMSGERFPFGRFKSGSGWSLEHIHAQNSEGLYREVERHEWLRLQIEALRSMPPTDEIESLIAEAVAAHKMEAVGEKFAPLYNKISLTLTPTLRDEYADLNMHSLRNLALLKCNDNAALNNSVFEVKRVVIAALDRKGSFVPVCTRNVFMKYYTPAGFNQPYFWGEKDREAYIAEIHKVLYGTDNDRPLDKTDSTER